jgi:DNA replication protein DnaC
VTGAHELGASLRALKLSGMLETLEARLAQARAGELGHLEFLQVLCEDEVSRRSATALARRVRAARFEEPYTLEDFDFTYNPKVPAALIRDLASLAWLGAGESIVLYGPPGVGKSHIAQALGHLACRRGHTVAYASCSRLLADLAGGHADGTWEARLHRWAKPKALVLDDVAMRPFTASQADDLYELVNERRHGSLVLASNRAPADWYGLFPNPVVAEGVLDRVVNSAHHVAMEGKSYRPNRRPGRAAPRL